MDQCVDGHRSCFGSTSLPALEKRVRVSWFNFEGHELYNKVLTSIFASCWFNFEYVGDSFGGLTDFESIPPSFIYTGLPKYSEATSSMAPNYENRTDTGVAKNF